MRLRMVGSEQIWDGAMILASAGIFLSIWSTGYLPLLDQPVWTVAFVALVGLASWFEIATEPYGTLNLSPVVILVAAAAYGIREAVLLAMVAPISVIAVRIVLARKATGVLKGLALGGETALALALASRWVGLGVGDVQLLRLLQLSVAFLVGMFLLRLLRVAAAEGVALRRLVRPLGRRALPHLIIMLAAVSVIWMSFSLMGLLGVVLSVVVLIETYYPWKLLGEQRALFLKSLQMMSNAVDLKDPYTAHHSRRVAENSVMLARGLGMPEEEVATIRIGALMHDIGKIAVPGAIIRKPSKLTDEEMALMKRHVQEGANLIQGLEVLQKSADIVRYHHENYDGSGYPSGLMAEAIPLGSRIVFVADAFDALTTDRPYRKGRSQSEAMEVVRVNAGGQFDPQVVEVMERIALKMRP